MDMRMLTYLERKMSSENEMENRRGVPNRRRNQIGFMDENENRRNENENRRNESENRRNEMRAHKEEYGFEDDDFEEMKLGRSKSMESKEQSQEIKELIELMEKSFKKELCDVLRYCKMSEIAEEEELTDIAEGLKALCHDEFTHAKFFRMGLRYFGEEAEKADPELTKLWQKVNRKMQ